MSIEADVDGGVKALWILPITVKSVLMKSISFNITLATTTDNDVNWQLEQVNSVTIGDVELTMSQWVWQEYVDHFHG